MSFILSIQVHIQNKYQNYILYILPYVNNIIISYIYIEKIYNINMLTQTGPGIKPRTPNI